jgi:hypothetical protein
MSHDQPLDTRGNCLSALYTLLQQHDRELAARVQEGRCLHCGGPLDVANYSRKPRGPEELLPDGVDYIRLSFCCRRCRKRHLPSSTLFLGRRIYIGLVVLLAPGMRRGCGIPGLRRVLEALQISYRTLRRWRLWWQETFAHSPFWKTARAMLFPRLPARPALPQALVAAFAADHSLAGLLQCLLFLCPLSANPPVNKRAWPWTPLSAQRLPIES